MMIPADMVAGVYGAWRLARRDPKGLIWFDASPGGFWRSFWGPALMLPGFLVLRALDGEFEEEWLRPLLVVAIGYVMGCVAYPLAMTHLVDGLERRALYYRYMVAYNWAAVVQMALLLPVSLLVHLLPGPGLSVLTTAAAVVLLVYQAYVAHVGLAVKPSTAGLLVVLDIMIGALIQMAVDQIIG